MNSGNQDYILKNYKIPLSDPDSLHEFRLTHVHLQVLQKLPLENILVNIKYIFVYFSHTTANTTTNQCHLVKLVAQIPVLGSNQIFCDLKKGR